MLSLFEMSTEVNSSHSLFSMMVVLVVAVHTQASRCVSVLVGLVYTQHACVSVTSCDIKTREKEWYTR